mmetsp:Transcript_7720/g.14562  ORF Transcript_7720/g.14562 Transcript_7720/m.14562 type:complete len:208 (-) Transcript_7720:1956-2579(-)
MPQFSKEFSAPSNNKLTPHYPPDGTSIPRPKSAAPQLNGNLFSNQRGKEKTVSSEMTDSLFRDFEIMHVGSRRAASAGVIENGDISSSNYLVGRDAPIGLSSLDKSATNEKHSSFMDVIQENSPTKSLSPGFQSSDSVTAKTREFNLNQVYNFKDIPDGNNMYKAQEIQAANYNRREVDGYANHLPARFVHQVRITVVCTCDILMQF